MLIHELQDKLKPWVCVPEGDVFNAAERALKLGYDQASVLVGCGGSIGFVEPFAKAFGMSFPRFFSLLALEDC